MSPRRTSLIAGNWKMYKTIEEAEQYARALLPKIASADGVEIGICVPFLALAPTVDSTRGSRLEVFPGGGHMLMLERTEALDRMIVDFAREVGATDVERPEPVAG